MAKKKLDFKKENLQKLLEDIKIGDICHYTEEIIKKDLEEDIDDAVKDILKSLFGAAFVQGKKTGNKKIDKNIPAYHGDKGVGKPDVILYNYFSEEEISIIIENKKFSSSEDPIPQAETYARIGDIIGKPVRVIIGNHPKKELDIRILVNNKYEPLIINGKQVHTFFGKEILKLIYDNPNINEFILVESIEKTFTQKDFHNIINKLKTYYRQITELGNNDDISINFTVAFIALKMIIEKQGIKWTNLKSYNDISNELQKIVGRTPNKDLKEKYENIFIIKDEKTDVETFNFAAILENINVRETNDGVTYDKSSISFIHKTLNDIPSGDLPIDLFGEVYESLASKKTKSTLGEFFTRRHIIQTIVRMFLSEQDISDIVEHKYKIADPACGTGGFLTESFKYIKEHCDKLNESLDDSEKIDISTLASEIMVGYDINPNNAGRTRINMTLAGDGFSDIRVQNSLTSKTYSKGIKYILTNVPYGKGDYAINDPNNSDLFIKQNSNKRLELNFVIKIIEMLDKGGKAAIIVPEGLLEAPTLAPFRDYLIRNCKLNTIISLPKFAFAPYTKWKTYVIFIEKRTTPYKSINDIKANERTWCYIVDNDGYANSDKRYLTDLKNEDGSYKHNELAQYVDAKGMIKSSLIEQKYEEQSDDNVKYYKNEWDEEIKGKKYGFISLEDIMEKQTSSYPTLTSAEVNNKLKNEANSNVILDIDIYNDFISLLTLNKKGQYIIKKEIYIEDKKLKEDFIPIFDQLQIMYDEEENKYYDLSKEQIILALPLIPEKYFRKKEVKNISLEELTNKVNEIENKLKTLLGGNDNEDK